MLYQVCVIIYHKIVVGSSEYKLSLSSITHEVESFSTCEKVSILNKVMLWNYTVKLVG